MEAARLLSDRSTRSGVAAQLFARVACLFSSTKSYSSAPCWLLGVAVKDGKRLFQAELVTRTPFPYHGDPADCNPDAPSIEWPGLPTWAGITGDPL